MSVAPQPTLQPEANIESTKKMNVSRYDNAASLLLALNAFVGFFVFLMFVVWLTTVIRFEEATVGIVFAEEDTGSGPPEGFANDMADPGMEEMEELEEPQIEATLEAVTDAVSSQMASLDSISTTATATGKGSGLGDKRGTGDGTPGGDVIPRWDRWQIQYEADNLGKYKAQLNFFNIELGAAGGGLPKIDYLAKFGNGNVKRQGTSKQEKRLYMTWNKGALAKADRQILQSAGVPVNRRVVMQFYPDATATLLAQAETAHALSNDVKALKFIRKTIFGVRQKGNRYEYYVIDQFYRNL